jgi:hypothetical protein
MAGSNQRLSVLLLCQAVAWGKKTVQNIYYITVKFLCTMSNAGI